MISNYSYLDTYSYYLNDMNTVRFYDEMNLAGARLSGKTHSMSEEIAKMIAISIAKDKRIAVYAFRKMNKDISDLHQEIESALERLGILDYAKITKPNNTYKYDFTNGSFINIRGIHTQNTSKIALKGLASCSDYDLAISWREEANEFNKAEVQAIDFAIRGAKRYVKWSSCNPDVLYQDHIQYINSRLPFDFEKMKKQHEQRKTIVENGLTKLFHYTNHKINPYLSESELSQLEELRILDPEKAYCWYWGMPGAVSTSIFTRYIDKVLQNANFAISHIKMGLDLGYANSPTGHPTVLEVVGFSSDYMKDTVIGEYSHNNSKESYMSPTQIYNDMLQYISNLVNKYPIMLNGVRCLVDYGAGGLVAIDELNRLKYNYELTFIEFVPVDKEVFYIRDRIDYMIACILNKWSVINWDIAPILKENLVLMKWEETSDLNKGSNLPKAVDLNDDGFDAWCYAHMEVMRDRMTHIPNYLTLSKNSTFRPKGIDDRQWNQRIR